MTSTMQLLASSSPTAPSAGQAKGGAWQCSQLFKGASCRMRDDWKLHTRPKELTLTERKRRALIEERDSAQQVQILPPCLNSCMQASVNIVKLLAMHSINVKGHELCSHVAGVADVCRRSQSMMQSVQSAQLSAHKASLQPSAMSLERLCSQRSARCKAPSPVFCPLSL